MNKKLVDNYVSIIEFEGLDSEDNAILNVSKKIKM
jgi:hypothetical protein